MTIKPEISKRKRAHESDTKTKLFYLFLIAQICSLFGLVVGVLFFILRLLRVIWQKACPVYVNLSLWTPALFHFIITWLSLQKRYTSTIRIL